MKRPTLSGGAFTLIELLIVVAIIAILAAIAVPNFLEAQTRSKVSRTRSDLRNLATGLEVYAVDNNKYPDTSRAIMPVKAGQQYAEAVLPKLSTPIAYLTTALLPDPFATPGVTIAYYGFTNHLAIEAVPDLSSMGVTGATPQAVDRFRTSRFLLLSLGPDKYPYLAFPAADPSQGADKMFVLLADPASGVGWNFVYDPTNGTVSVGDVFRTGGGTTNQ